MRTDRAFKSVAGLRRPGRPVKKCELGFQFALGDTLPALNPEHWNALTQGQSLFLQRGFRRIMDLEGPKSLRTRYGILYRDHEPLAAVMAHIAPASGRLAHLDYVDDRRFGRPAGSDGDRESTLDVVWQAPARHLMFCGDFYAGGFHGVAFREGEDAVRLLPGVAMLLQRIQANEGLSPDNDLLLIKDLPSTLATAARGLRAFDYRRMDTSPNMVFELSPRWRHYDDYLQQLNVRLRLVAVRAARDLCRQGYETRTLTYLAPWAHRMHALCQSVQRRSGGCDLPLPENTLPALAHQIDPSLFRCTALFQGDTMMGFVFTLRDRDTAICYCAGWDTDAGQSLPLLPSLLHSVIGDALSLRCSRINFGRTALRIKAQLGAAPELSESWLCHAGTRGRLRVSTILETLSHAPTGDVASPLPI